jgi:hypothetical protein
MFDENRNTWFLAFILLALGTVALIGSGFPVILMLFGLLFLVRQFDTDATNNHQQTRRSDTTDWYGYDATSEDSYDDFTIFNQPSTTKEQSVYRHALDSVTRAGLNPDTVSVLTVDIGLLTSKGDSSPQIYRTWSLPDDIDYIQPFVQLRVPKDAEGNVRFEIVDALGHIVYVHEDQFNLKRGRNFLTPSTRMPVHDQLNLNGEWGLRIVADNITIAEHIFEYAENNSANIRQHIGEDGEINVEMRAVMTENINGNMSLDELLAHQDDADEQQQQG